MIAILKVFTISFISRCLTNVILQAVQQYDAKWLKGYERATLYGETLELMDYSPEIDTHLKIICFPTFKGHCGCILFDVDKIWFEQHSEDSAKTLARYYAKLPNNK